MRRRAGGGGAASARAWQPHHRPPRPTTGGAFMRVAGTGQPQPPQGTRRQLRAFDVRVDGRQRTRAAAAAVIQATRRRDVVLGARLPAGSRMSGAAQQPDALRCRRQPPPQARRARRAGSRRSRPRPNAPGRRGGQSGEGGGGGRRAAAACGAGRAAPRATVGGKWSDAPAQTTRAGTGTGPIKGCKGRRLTHRLALLGKPPSPMKAFG